MNLKKLSLLGLLLCVLLPTNTWTVKEDKKDSKQESFWDKHAISIRNSMYFIGGALYTGARVFFDPSEPTLNGFLKSSGKRALGVAAGSFLGSYSMSSAIQSVAKSEELLTNKVPSKSFKDSLANMPFFFKAAFTNPNTYKNILAHAAYREAFFHRASHPASFSSGLLWGILTMYYSDQEKINGYSPYSMFCNGKLFGALFGVGLRYRHELGSGLKLTSHSLKQTSLSLAAFVRSAVKYGLEKYRARTMAA
ncbi:MAG: hypothetical protein UV38_C0003G0163 [candidate division TM6 bacterium GW2011_GWE2_42_60]|nr:MAG: hypothetical protein UV38_C0003G0163 [candidate division TM6 bacterium GW2011_GWE2_42_60]